VTPDALAEVIAHAYEFLEPGRGVDEEDIKVATIVLAALAREREEQGDPRICPQCGQIMGPLVTTMLERVVAERDTLRAQAAACAAEVARLTDQYRIAVDNHTTEMLRSDALVGRLVVERDAFKGAFQIMFNCHHGDETTCGCREHARALLADLGQPSTRREGS
jgi:hypothetical protein